MFEDFNLNKKDYYYLIALTVFSFVLTCYYIIFNWNLGIYCSDVYIYLLNALYYTGINIRATGTIYLSPIICFLTSIFFRAGLVDRLAIYIVTGAFAIIGNIGLYILFKRYFNEILSITGCIIYSSLTLYLTWFANGTLDVPAVSITIWMVLFTVIAIKDNPKFYRYAIPLMVLGIFTRYTVILTIPALALYYVYEKGFKIESADFKEISKGLAIGLIIAVIILGVVFIMGAGHFGASGQVTSGISGAQGSNIDPAYNEDVSYYVSNFLNFISNSHTVIDGNPVLENPTPLSYAVIGILIIGMGLWIYDHRRKLERNDLISIAFLAIAAVSFTRISSVLTTVLVLIGIYFMGKDNDSKDTYFMLAWIFSNIIFFSYFNIKVSRYVLPVFPAVTYFVLLSIDTINRRIKINGNIIPLIFIILFVIQAFTFTMTFEDTYEFKATEDMSSYIMDNNPDYENLSIGAYNIRAFDWWMKCNLLPIKSSNESQIDSSNATYYISNRVLENVENYTLVKNIDKVYLYEKSV